ncbi:MAG TPA: DUF6326 family protein [Longimicrobiales bacterium]|nr:DUF6326 family protein [Longimicrobiales bacterium]
MITHAADSSPDTTVEMKSTKVLLSTLWVFAVFNYLYADVVTLMDSETLKMIMTGQVGSIRMTRGVLFGAAVLIETAIVMILLSRILEYRLNRWANIIAGAIHTAAVALSVVAGEGTPALYYVFFAIIEIACTVFIIWYAWRWKPTARTVPAFAS